MADLPDDYQQQCEQVDAIVEMALRAAGNSGADPRAITAGAMMALVRWALQTGVLTPLVAVLTPRDVIGYFMRHLQLAAEALLAKPPEGGMQ